MPTVRIASGIHGEESPKNLPANGGFSGGLGQLNELDF